MKLRSVFHTRRARVLGFIGLGIVGLALLVAVVWTVPALRDRVRGRLQQAGVLPPPLPTYVAPIASPERVTARRLAVAALHDALARRDYPEAAMLNAVLSQEAFHRASRVVQAWETTRDPETGLIPHATSSFYRQWDSEDVAADLYPHLLIASLYLDADNAGGWLDMLGTEQSICGSLACQIDLKTGRIVEQDLETRIFGTSEYAKDGLLAVTERFGSGPWLDRMVAGVDAILDNAQVQTPFGLIPSNGTEANGELLQVLSRLYWATGEERYLQMAERIAEVYLLEILPNNHGLPADYWNFKSHRPQHEDERFRPAAEGAAEANPFRLVDHGGEIIPGLAELYFLERMHGRAQADRYRQPLQQFLNQILITGRTDDGLWVNSVDVETGQPFDARLADTWGYLLNGFQTFDLAEGTAVYSAEIERTMRAASTRHSIHWEYNWQDGYADAIESMLYLLPWFDIPECHHWVDDEIEVLFLKQQDNGFVEEWYLDGNFARTALMYAWYKAQGLRLTPWQKEVRLGASMDRSSDTLYIYVAAQQSWQGRLLFDTPRHRIFWNLPQEYPRLNGLPEWYIVEPKDTYLVTNLDTGESDTHSGQELAAGLPIAFDIPGSLRLAVTRQ